MKFKLFIFSIFASTFSMNAQNQTLPYYELPTYPEQFTAGTVAARQIDALGFRYYWATENLNEKDLAYKPSKEARTSLETLQHIYDLSKIIVNATLKKSNERSNEAESMSYEELRKQTLINLKNASEIVMKANDLTPFNIVFGKREFPYWNNINGPIADAIWHCGQLVTLRRITENPINNKVNLFTGTVRD